MKKTLLGKMIRRVILVCFATLLGGGAIYAQSSVEISGTVVDAAGQPIVGAVVVDASQVGTSTGLDGTFALKTKLGSKVTVSCIGYKTTEFEVLATQTVYNISMNDDATMVEDVVVVGYGVQKKVNMTGSVASVNFAEQLSRPVNNVSSALAGLASGVNVRQTSGNPGSDGATIRIRGLGTLNSSEPLVLVDGMEAPIDAVNAQDVESVSFLKDASSAAIYGSKAANGVILITTKKGSAKDFTITYQGRASIAKPTRLTQTVSNYADYMEYMNEGFENLGQAANFSQETIDAWRTAEKNPNAIDPASGLPNYVVFPNTDWHKVFFGNTNIIQEHNVSLSGGSDKIRFLTSAGFLNNPGLVYYTGYKKFSVRTNLEADVTKWLTVGTRIWGYHSDKEPGDFGTALGYVGQSAPGVYPKYNGVYGGAEAQGERAGNPFMHHLKYYGENVDTRINTTLFSRIKLYDGLEYEVNFNYEKRFNNQSSWSNGDIYLVKFSTGEIYTPATTPENMTVSEYRYDNYKYTLENLLRYNKTFNKIHDVSALAGYQEYYYYERSMQAQKKGLLDGNIHTLSSAEEMLGITGAANDVATRSWFGRVNYAFMGRYLLEANLRADASSKFKKEYRWGYFPSVSAGWRISEENFMSSTRGWLDNMKLYGSYGVLGNTNGVSNYAYQSTYSIVNYSMGGSQAQGLYSGSIANQAITWESTAVTNIGLELGMLNNRLSANVEVYKRFTNGILYAQTIPGMAGNKTAPLENLAEVTNRGIEFTAGWRDQVGDFRYAVSANVSYNRNVVTKYKGKFEAGWVETVNEDGTTSRTYVSNVGDVRSGGIVEGKEINEHFIKDVYKGSGDYFNADGTVNINGGPRDGMIRTTDDMEWFQAMRDAGYRFAPRLNNTTGVIGKNTIWYGDYIYADRNEDGIYGNAYDQYFRGTSSTPKYNFGMQMQAEWKGIDLSMTWAGAAGFMLNWGNSTGYNSTNVRLGVSMPAEIFADHYYYDPENPSDPRTNINAKYGRLVNAETGYQNQENSNLYLYKGDYLKLKNLTLGYTLPKAWTDRIHTKRIRIYLSGENLFTLTDYPGVDPEMGAGVGYATVRQFAAGLNITF